MLDIQARFVQETQGDCLDDSLERCKGEDDQSIEPDLSENTSDCS